MDGSAAQLVRSPPPPPQPEQPQQQLEALRLLTALANDGQDAGVGVQLVHRSVALQRKGGGRRGKQIRGNVDGRRGGRRGGWRGGGTAGTLPGGTLSALHSPSLAAVATGPLCSTIKPGSSRSARPTTCPQPIGRRPEQPGVPAQR